MSHENKNQAMPPPKRSPKLSPKWTDELLASRRNRAKVTGLLLGAFVLLFFLITVVRLGANIMNRPL